MKIKRTITRCYKRRLKKRENVKEKAQSWMKPIRFDNYINCNGLNTSTKREILLNLIAVKDPTTYSLQERYFEYKDKDRLNVK